MLICLHVSSALLVGFFSDRILYLRHFCMCVATRTAERTVASGKEWHKTCFSCAQCGKILQPGKHSEVFCLLLNTS